MKFGISLPPFGDYADIHHLATMAKEAEEAGWDGFFLWDHIFFDPSFHANVDPLQLEVVEIDDVVRIELNVATSAEAIFKDAAELSRGQKCTALLPCRAPSLPASAAPFFCGSDHCGGSRRTCIRRLARSGDHADRTRHLRSI